MKVKELITFLERQEECPLLFQAEVDNLNCHFVFLSDLTLGGFDAPKCVVLGHSPLSAIRGKRWREFLGERIENFYDVFGIWGSAWENIFPGENKFATSKELLELLETFNPESPLITVQYPACREEKHGFIEEPIGLVEVKGVAKINADYIDDSATLGFDNVLVFNPDDELLHPNFLLDCWFEQPSENQA